MISLIVLEGSKKLSRITRIKFPEEFRILTKCIERTTDTCEVGDRSQRWSERTSYQSSRLLGSARPIEE